jgi:hypothetical protein
MQSPGHLRRRPSQARRSHSPVELPKVWFPGIDVRRHRRNRDGLKDLRCLPIRPDAPDKRSRPSTERYRPAGVKRARPASTPAMKLSVSAAGRCRLAAASAKPATPDWFCWSGFTHCPSMSLGVPGSVKRTGSLAQKSFSSESAVKVTRANPSVRYRSRQALQNTVAKPCPFAGSSRLRLMCSISRPSAPGADVAAEDADTLPVAGHAADVLQSDTRLMLEPRLRLPGRSRAVDPVEREGFSH